MIKIKISSDFSEIPSGRTIAEGDHSGEEFRDTILIQKYEEAEKKNESLEIDFDGCYGFGTSFLEEAFGGLVRKYHKHDVYSRLKIISTEDETIPGNVEEYLRKAEAEDL